MDYTKEVERLARESERKTRGAKPVAIDTDFGESTAAQTSGSVTQATPSAQLQSLAAALAHAAQALKSRASETADNTTVQQSEAATQAPANAPSAKESAAPKPTGRWIAAGVYAYFALNFFSRSTDGIQALLAGERDVWAMAQALGMFWVGGILALSGVAAFAAPASPMKQLAQRLRLGWVIVGVIAAVGALSSVFATR
jgi:hypothetical protein